MQAATPDTLRRLSPAGVRRWPAGTPLFGLHGGTPRSAVAVGIGRGVLPRG